MHERPATLVVIGASGRAFGVSAARAGWRVCAADLFGDVDLREAAAGSVCVRSLPGGYPAALVDAARSFPDGPFCYVGALENHPEVVRAVARDRRLFGSPPDAVATVRDPWSLRALAREAGLECPDCRSEPHGLPADGSYLRKPLAGAGGRGIVPWDTASPAAPVASFWQRRIDGHSWSIAYLVSAAGGRMLGASRQLTGEPWCHARPFAYCGSVEMPIEEIPEPLRRQFASLAPLLARCGLQGAVGADFMVDAAGTAWVIEVNPRPTASMELHERSTGGSIAAAHIDACGGPPARGDAPAPRADGMRHAKAVIHAPAAVSITADWLAWATERRRLWSAGFARPGIADIPAAGADIAAGGPICTVFATASSMAAAVVQLRERATAVLAAVSPPGGAASPPAATPGSIP